MTIRTIVHRASAFAAVLLAGACGSGMLNVGYPTGASGGGGASIGTPANYVGALSDSLKHGTPRCQDSCRMAGVISAS
jgi:hypothetical protein